MAVFGKLEGTWWWIVDGGDRKCAVLPPAAETLATPASTEPRKPDRPPQVSTAVLRRRQRRHLVCPRSCFPFLPLNWLNWKSLSVSHVSINFSLRKIHVPIRIPSYINFTFFANTCNSDMLRILKSYRAMLTNPQQEDSIKKDNRWRRSRDV